MGLKKLFSLVLFIFLVSTLGFSQSAQRIVPAIQNPVGGGNYAILGPNASVYVCTYNAQLTCNSGNYTTIYKDVTLLSPITQPVVADTNGVYQYFIASGSQVVEKVCFNASQCQPYGIYFSPSGSIVSLPLGIPFGGTGTSTTSQNYVFAGPTSGSGSPSFRALVLADIPSLASLYCSIGQCLPITGGAITGNLSVAGTTTLTGGTISGPIACSPSSACTGTLTNLGGAALTGAPFTGPVNGPEFAAGPLPLLTSPCNVNPIWGANIHTYTPELCGAKADSVRVTDGVMASTSSGVLTSVSGLFTSAMVGKTALVVGAGAPANGGGSTLLTTVASYQSATQITLAALAAQTVAGALVFVGTDDSTAVNTCVSSALPVGNRCHLTDGATYIVTKQQGVSGNGGSLDGRTNIIFAPANTSNENWLVIGGSFQTFTGGYNCAQINGNIGINTLSFTAQNSSDAATLYPGEWIIPTIRSTVDGQIIQTDWTQVASVVGTTITVTNPFRQTFTNPGSWTGSTCQGLGFYAAATLASNQTFKDFTVVVMNVGGTAYNATALYSQLSLNLVVQNTTCYNPGLCMEEFLNKGSQIINNHWYGETESAASVDTKTLGNYNDGSPSIWYNYAPSPFRIAAITEFDLGSAYFIFQGNHVVNLLGGGSALPLLYGVHDGVIEGNEIGWNYTTVGSQQYCITGLGAYGNVVSDNICEGSTGSGGSGLATYAILFSDDATHSINSTYNKFVNNRSINYTNAYNLTGSSNTDAASYIDESGNMQFIGGRKINSVGGFQHNGASLALATDISDYSANLTWTPVATNLTTVGTPTITGNYTVVGRVVFYHISIVPSTSTASTANSTFITLPITVTGTNTNCDGTVAATTTYAENFGNGCNQGTTATVYTPTWSASAHVISISGWYRQ